MKSWFTLFILFVLVSTLGYTQVTNKLDNLQVGTLTTKTIDVTSTTKASKPCPKVTLEERDNILFPLEGQCVYNSTAKTLNIFNGSSWVAISGGEGGIASWENNKFYDVGDLVIYENDIYKCTVQHTSDVNFEADNFQILAQDLLSTVGILPLAKGGTGKNMLASAGSVVYSDSNSYELTNVGTAGQFLQSNGNLAPSWEQISVDDNSFSGVLSLGKGGTNKALTAQDKAIVYSDTDSLELLAPGTEGQVLKMGASAPVWGDEAGGLDVSPNYASPTKMNELVVPNDQLTEIAANKYYLESEAKNILKNPSFEADDTFWNLVSGVSNPETNIKIDGGYSISLFLSNQTLNFYQDSSQYSDQFADGIQLLAYARVKTSVSGVKLCPRKAGVTQTSLCVSHTGSGKWELLKVPFVSSGTSNGLAIITDSARSGTVYVDDSFLGAVDLKADIQGVKSDVFEITSSQNGYGSSYTSNPRFSTVTKRLDAGLLTYSDSSTQGASWTANRAVNVVLTLSGPYSSTAQTILVLKNQNTSGQSGTFLANVNFNGGQRYNLSSSFRLEAGDKISFFYTNGVAQWTRDVELIGITATEITNGSTYSSTNADTSLADYTPTFNSGFSIGTGGNASSRWSWFRDGQFMVIKGGVRLGSSGFSIGTGTFTLTIPSGYQIDNSKFYNNSDGYPVVGFARLGDTSSSVERVTPIVINGNSTTTLFFGNGLNYGGITTSSPWVWAADDFINVDEIRIPIQGWENSNIIIGQFNGLESCASAYECESTFSAYFNNSGTTVTESIDWVSGNATVATNYTIPLVTSKLNLTESRGMNCVVTADNTGRAGRILSSNQNQIVVTIYNTNTQVAVTDTGFWISCQKQGADYIGKTAKAVSAQDSVIAPDSKLVRMIQFRYQGGSGNCTTSPCTALTDFGGVSVTVTRTSLGRYVATLPSGTFKANSNFNCYMNAVNTGTDIVIPIVDAAFLLANSSGGASFELFTKNQTATALVDSKGIITCTGMMQ